MDLPSDVVSALFDAGADALTFNAPLSIERATTLVEGLSRQSATSVVDLGCGRGELARMAAARMPQATVVGVDVDERLVRAARELTASRALDHRVSFEVGDAAVWSGAADAAICVGASHAFGGTVDMLSRLAVLVPAGSVVIGDAIWRADPDTWCRETFGDLPNGPEALVAEAVRAGWTVIEADQSTLAEWDSFEQGWIGGVRAVGTEEAAVFSDQREREYQEYRGVLGFCWLVLSR